jgi:hypothetical protein
MTGTYLEKLVLRYDPGTTGVVPNGVHIEHVNGVILARPFMFLPRAWSSGGSAFAFGLWQV